MRICMGTRWVGGTNPSLLEAMASDVMMLAHDNIFNRAVLKENAFFYKDAADVTALLNDMERLVAENKERIVEGNLKEIRENYSWEHLVDQHEEYFEWLMKDGRKNATNAK